MYAFDARTGEEIWSVELTGRNTEYGRLLYGPWASHARLIPDDGLLVSTFSDLRSLDRVSGDERRVSAEDTLSGQVSYTPPAVTEFGILAFDGGTGDAHLLDVESGELLWHSPALPENRGAAPGPVEGAHEREWWMVGKTGLLLRFDPEVGDFESLLQVSRTFTGSTSAIVAPDEGERVLIVGDNDGNLRGISGLDTSSR